MVTPRKEARTALFRLALALFVFGCGSLVSAVARAGEDPVPAPVAPADGADNRPSGRIGVVRLQEVIEHNPRYIYLTARFTEEYRLLYAAQSGEINLLAELMQLKFDLNKVLTQAILIDVRDAVKAVAASRKLDGVADGDSLDALAKGDRRRAGSLATAREGGGIFVPLAGIPPATYADAAVDLTDAVSAELARQYNQAHGVGGKADPLLTQPLTKIASQLKALQAQAKAQAAAATPAAPATVPAQPPVIAGDAVGALNLQLAVNRILAARKYDAAFLQRSQQLEQLKIKYADAKQKWEDHAEVLKQKPQPPETPELSTLADEASAVMKLQRDGRQARMVFAALTKSCSEQVLAEIHLQLAQLVREQHLQRAVVLSGPAPLLAEIENLAGGGAIPVTPGEKAVDLTQQVVDAVEAAYAKRIAAKPRDPNDLFDLGISEADLVAQYMKEIQSADEQQKADDQRRFAAWHAFQKQMPRPAPATPQAP